jgi:hypothetical protein
LSNLRLSSFQPSQLRDKEVDRMSFDSRAKVHGVGVPLPFGIDSIQISTNACPAPPVQKKRILTAPP